MSKCKIGRKEMAHRDSEGGPSVVIDHTQKIIINAGLAPEGYLAAPYNGANAV
jgi:hypothetical protein